MSALRLHGCELQENCSSREEWDGSLASTPIAFLHERCLWERILQRFRRSSVCHPDHQLINHHDTWKWRLGQDAGDLLRNIESELHSLQRRRDNELLHLAAQLYWLESRLRKEQLRLKSALQEKDRVIHQQHRSIHRLLVLHNKYFAQCKEDALDDDDSAVIMEEEQSCCHTANHQRLMRSVSDALECACIHRRRQKQRQGSEREWRGSRTPSDAFLTVTSKSKSVENLDVCHREGLWDSRGMTMTTTHALSRVDNTHRNVTKPKDVKRKRMNKMKSRSLEEIRIKLRDWVVRKTPSKS
ncbi:unnamed protein product [Darwinula stevensoni]|uniref:Uncharacterized protein n=1 Tax=Darwinula stevensoni TaxID=69355 RepID=A0A7R9FR52_9CRUS|nr:unnamed protein product [Darwinula stevensoni]CAG0900981.1 unnamed protein product [Darwinula stevensoni]